MKKRKYIVNLHAKIYRITKIVLLSSIFIQMISCNERSSTKTNYNELDSVTLNYLQNRVKVDIDSLYQVYKKRFENNYWYVSMYRCGKQEYKFIGKELDTITFFFVSKKNLHINNKEAGTWNLKKINGKFIRMNLNIETSIEKIYLPPSDYWFIYVSDSIFVLQTRYGKSEDKVLVYQMSLKRL